LGGGEKALKIKEFFGFLAGVSARSNMGLGSVKYDSRSGRIRAFLRLGKKAVDGDQPGALRLGEPLG
jgi:hypothetical protein